MECVILLLIAASLWLTVAIAQREREDAAQRQWWLRSDRGWYEDSDED